jgi:ABC-type sugar transport system substrate-binding protein
MVARNWVPLILSVFLVSAVTGCGFGRDEDDGEDGGSIAVFLSNGGDPYFQNKSYGYKQADDELDGYKVEMFDAGGYENVEKQVAQVEDAVTRSVDAIVLTPVDSKALCGPVQSALDADIPVVVDDIMLDCEFEVPVGISENSVNVGRNECEYMAEQIGGEGGIVMLKGPPGAKIAIDRANGCKQALEDYPDIEILAEQWGESNIEVGNDLMDDFLSSHGGDIDAVYTFGAITALGAVNAIESAGENPSDFAIATIDLHPEVLAYMEKGQLDGTIPAQPVRLARLTALAAASLADGDPVEGESDDPCCEVRQYTDDEEVIDNKALPEYDDKEAVAPEGWEPPLQG